MSKRKPGPRIGHARELHDKVDQLGKSLSTLRSQFERYTTQPDGGETDSLGRMKLPSGSNDNTPQSANAMGTAVQAVEGAEHHRLAILTVNTFSDQEREAPAVLRSEPQSRLRTTTADSTTASSEYDGFLKNIGLPPHRQLTTLVELYFEHVNACIPLLEQESMLQILRDPFELDEPDQILLHALVLSGSRYWKGPEMMRREYHESSKRRIQVYVLEHSNIRGMQALVVLTIDVLGDAYTVEAMNLLTLLARNFSHLGLCVEHRFDLGLCIYAPAGLTQSSMISHPVSWLEEEERRRLFWAAYIIDRYTNTSTSSNYIIDEREVNRPLPCRYALWVAGEQVETRWYRTDLPFEVSAGTPENLGSFSYLCEVARLMTRIHEFVKRPLDFYSTSEVSQWKSSYAQLDRQLSSWLKGLPCEYAQISESFRPNTRIKASNWVLLQSGFILAAIRLHSVAGYPPMVSNLFKASHSAMHKCLAAVMCMMRTAQDVVSVDMLRLLGPLFAGALWVTGRLLLVHASVPGNHLDPSIYFFISTLERMGEHWPLAKVFSSRLLSMLPQAQTEGHSNTLEDLRK